MSEDNDSRRIIDLKTRQPVNVPAPKKARKKKEKPAPDLSDPEDIEILEEMIKLARTGRLKGFLVIAGIFPPEKEAPEFVESYASPIVADNYQIYLGGIEEFKHHLISAAADRYFEIEYEE